MPPDLGDLMVIVVGGHDENGDVPRFGFEVVWSGPARGDEPEARPLAIGAPLPSLFMEPPDFARGAERFAPHALVIQVAGERLVLVPMEADR